MPTEISVPDIPPRASTARPRFDLYVMDISYFSGKLECYFNFKELDYRRLEPTLAELQRIARVHTGSSQVPLVHDTATGERLATFPLPAGLHAGPISVRARADGPQLLIVAAGGHIGIGSPLGDYVIAYTLPEPEREP